MEFKALGQNIFLRINSDQYHIRVKVNVKVGKHS